MPLPSEELMKHCNGCDRVNCWRDAEGVEWHRGVHHGVYVKMPDAPEFHFLALEKTRHSFGFDEKGSWADDLTYRLDHVLGALRTMQALAK